MPTAIRPDVRKRFRAIVAKVDRRLAAERVGGVSLDEADEADEAPASITRRAERDEEDPS